MRLAIVIPTYNRALILQRNLANLREYALKGIEHRFFIGNAGNDDTETRVAAPDVEVLHHAKQGLGQNLNNILNTAAKYSPYVLQMDDDHILLQHMDLTPHLQYLEEQSTVAWIRLMEVAAHNYTADLRGRYWEVRWDSPELYIPSMRPHLKHIHFHEFFGLYPEGLKLGQTEEGFCHVCREVALKSGGPKVAVPLNVLTESSWSHVGDSWQMKGF